MLHNSGPAIGKKTETYFPDPVILIVEILIRRILFIEILGEILFLIEILSSLQDEIL